MTERKLISSDSHIVETPDWYFERVDARYKDHVPRIVKDADEQLVVQGFPGMSPFPAKGYVPNAVGQSPTGKDTGDFCDTPAGAWDPAVRLKDMDRDGVSAEVLYPTIGLRTFTLEDADLRAACFRAHNDQLSDYVSAASERLLAVAMLETQDIDAAVKELERCVRSGHRGAMVTCSPPEDRPFSSDYYDKLWAAACEMDIPISLHVLTGTGQRRLMRNVLTSLPIYFRHEYVVELQESIIRLVEGGTFERFPKLKMITVESGVGWMLGLATNADFAWLRHQSSLPRRPSEYIKENIFATFQQDSGVRANILGGYTNFMWASDYPHGDSTWPVSQDVVAKDFAGVDEAATRAITFDNAAQAYGLAA